jgi:transposase
MSGEKRKGRLAKLNDPDREKLESVKQRKMALESDVHRIRGQAHTYIECRVAPYTYRRVHAFVREVD